MSIGLHDTALAIGGEFLRRYSRAGDVIVEIGACVENGSLRPLAHSGSTYFGIDIHPGPGVDIVTEPDQPLPVASGSADIIIATSMFEHDSFFWQTFLEMLRVLKPGGVIYVNAPSNGSYHRYPTDNWRFYPDAGKVLEKWGVRNGYELQLVESFVADRRADHWNDFVAIFQRAPVGRFHEFLSDNFPCGNVWRIGLNEILHFRELSEDMRLVARLQEELHRAESGERPSLVRGLGPAPGNGRLVEEDAPVIEDDQILQQRRFVEYLGRIGLDTRAAEAQLKKLLLQRAPDGGPAVLEVSRRSQSGS
jgi:SAM-dependent methyltransferase